MTTISSQFTTAKQFADFMSANIWGTRRVRSLNATTWDIRLENLVRDCERASGDSIEFEWNNVAYGLVRVVTTGRVNGQTALAIRAMKVRQLCELMFLLRENCESIEDYAKFLMHRYTQAAA